MDNKIYEHANEQHLRTIVFYGNASDGKLYRDENKTERATNEEAFNAYIKGIMLIKKIGGTGFNVPIYGTEAGSFKAIDPTGSELAVASWSAT